MGRKFAWAISEIPWRGVLSGRDRIRTVYGQGGLGRSPLKSNGELQCAQTRSEVSDADIKTA